MTVMKDEVITVYEYVTGGGSPAKIIFRMDDFDESKPLQDLSKFHCLVGKTDPLGASYFESVGTVVDEGEDDRSYAYGLAQDVLGNFLNRRLEANRPILREDRSGS
jgi:hypothetical protein